MDSNYASQMSLEGQMNVYVQYFLKSLVILMAIWLLGLPILYNIIGMNKSDEWMESSKTIYVLRRMMGLWFWG